MCTISYHLQDIQERIVKACALANRPSSSVQLLAVSKTFGEAAIQKAINAGHISFGENYVAEGVSKIQHFLQLGQALEWHMIGQIQSNKTKEVAEYFHWVHAIDRIRIAKRLSDQRPPEMGKLQVCIAVNVSAEENKGGVEPNEVEALAEQISLFPNLVLRGLMCIPEPAQTVAEQRRPFKLLRSIFEGLQKKGHPVDTLSMGMSEDLEAAILEGATLVRVGRGIFGAREVIDRENTQQVQK